MVAGPGACSCSRSTSPRARWSRRCESGDRILVVQGRPAVVGRTAATSSSSTAPTTFGAAGRRPRRRRAHRPGPRRRRRRRCRSAATRATTSSGSSGCRGTMWSAVTPTGRLQRQRPVAVTEPYLHAGDDASDLTFDVRVPAGRIWVMGDHRSDSADSRAHLGDPGGGMVPTRGRDRQREVRLLAARPRRAPWRSAAELAAAPVPTARCRARAVRVTRPDRSPTDPAARPTAADAGDAVDDGCAVSGDAARSPRRSGGAAAAHDAARDRHRRRHGAGAVAASSRPGCCRRSTSPPARWRTPSSWATGSSSAS